MRLIPRGRKTSLSSLIVALATVSLITAGCSSGSDSGGGEPAGEAVGQNPINDPLTPGSDTTSDPMQGSTPDAMDDPMQGSAPDAMDDPMQGSTPDAMDDPMQGSAPDAMDDPMQGSTPDAMDDPMQGSTPDAMDDPMQGSTPDAMQDPMQGSTPDAMDDPMQGSTPDAMDDPMQGSTPDAMDDPMQDPMPVAEPTSQQVNIRIMNTGTRESISSVDIFSGMPVGSTISDNLLASPIAPGESGTVQSDVCGERVIIRVVGVITVDGIPTCGTTLDLEVNADLRDQVAFLPAPPVEPMTGIAEPTAQQVNIRIMNTGARDSISSVDTFSGMPVGSTISDNLLASPIAPGESGTVQSDVCGERMIIRVVGVITVDGIPTCGTTLDLEVNADIRNQVEFLSATLRIRNTGTDELAEVGFVQLFSGTNFVNASGNLLGEPIEAGESSNINTRLCGQPVRYQILTSEFGRLIEAETVTLDCASTFTVAVDPSEPGRPGMLRVRNQSSESGSYVNAVYVDGASEEASSVDRLYADTLSAGDSADINTPDCGTVQTVLVEGAGSAASVLAVDALVACDSATTIDVTFDQGLLRSAN